MKRLIAVLASQPRLADRVRDDADALRQRIRASRQPVAVQLAALEEVPAARAKLADLLVAGLAVLARVREHERTLDGLGADEVLALRVLHLVYGRPALPVRNDQFPPSPPGWEILEGSRRGLEASLRAVGRVELLRSPGDGAPGRQPMGTAFLVGADWVITARHVAADLAARLPPAGDAARASVKGALVLGAGAEIDWRVELGEHAQARCTLTEWLPLRHHDVALMRLGEGARRPRAKPLALGREAPPVGALVCVMGYPLVGGEGDLTAAQLNAVFPGLLGTKRVCPGVVVEAEVATHLGHDASTLGGSSGSPLFAVEAPERVVAVHVQGHPGVANLAIPLSEVLDAFPRDVIAGAG